MSQLGSLRQDRDRINSSLFVAGVAIILASVIGAAWMLRLGDIVTALGLGLLIAAGVLMSGIGLSKKATL